MTIFYPDLSNYQAGYQIPTGTPAVVAKATEGTYYQDASYEDFKAQAARLGAVFSGYHFLKAESSPEAQAQYYHDFAGAVPCMLDVETEGTSKPGVDWCLRFITALKGLGGRVWGVYLPQWYWQEVGGDLSRLTAAGSVLIASDYTAYSDGGSGWNEYGNAVPAVWQYTSTPIDMNAFKGTAAQLALLIGGSVILGQDDIAAIAKAVYEYGEETVFSEGTNKIPLGNLAHGGWVSTNDPNGIVVSKLDQILAKLSNEGKALQ